MPSFDYKKLDSILHSRIRLAIVSVLVSVESIEFTKLRDMVDATDGNMNAQLKKLEDAGYISVKKEFVDKKPTTSYTLTQEGRNQFQAYVEELEKFIKP